MCRSIGTLNRVSWDTRNTAKDIDGTVVQAGHIDHVSIASAPGRPPVPRQLPLAVPDFTGRLERLAELDAWLTGGGTVSAVVGTAGVGKTSLVVRWARQVQYGFSGGTLYVNLNGYGPGTPAEPGDVLTDFLSALGIMPEWIPPRLDARAALYRSVLAERQVLVVLDNAHDVAQVRPLLPGGPGCAVVVTSRADLAGLEIGDGARRFPLPLFSEREAKSLVHGVLGPERTGKEPEAVAALVEACARLPLALRIAAGRAAAHPHLKITEIVEELRTERWTALKVPADEDRAVRTVFGWSYRRLPPDQALMFRHIGRHQLPGIGVAPAAALQGIELRAARDLLAGLAEQHLVEPVGRDRYICHDLLRAYAADLAEQDDDQALRRLCEWYTHHAVVAHRTLFPDREKLHAAAGLTFSGHPEITFAGPGDAWAWVQTELVNAVAVTRAAARHGWSDLTMSLGDLVAGADGLIGRWDEALELCELGLEAARSRGDRRAECWLAQVLGQLYRGVDRWEEATEVFTSVLELARALGDDQLEVEVLAHLGWGCLELEQYPEALRHLEEALERGAAGRAPAFVEYCLSGVWTGLGDHEKGLRHAERSLELLAQAGIDDARCNAWHAMARARQLAGAHAEAIALCRRAIDAAPVQEVPRNHALTLDTLGESLRQTGDVAGAAACWHRALAIFDTYNGGSQRRTRDLRARLRELAHGPSANAG